MKALIREGSGEGVEVNGLISEGWAEGLEVNGLISEGWAEGVRVMAIVSRRHGRSPARYRAQSPSQAIVTWTKGGSWPGRGALTSQ